VADLSITSGFVYAGLSYSVTLNQFVLTANNYTGLYVFQSANGNNWFMRSFVPTSRQVITVVSSTNVIYALGETGLALFSRDAVNWDLLSGTFWTTVKWILKSSDGLWCGPALNKDDPRLRTVPFYSTPDGVTWTRNPENASDLVLTFSNTPIYSRAAKIYLATDRQAVWVSEDLLTWENVFNASYYNIASITSIYMSPDESVFVLTGTGVRTDVLFLSTDGAKSWGRVANHQFTKLHRIFPVGPSTFLNTQTDQRGKVWLFVSKDGGATYTNTSATVSSVEVAWLLNSKSVLHVGFQNVTTASINDLASWTTQRMNVSSAAQFLVFRDTFYGIENNKVWSSPDGISWMLDDSPYYTSVVGNYAVSEDELLGVGDYAVAVGAK
jgi:hypothetical protein